jgi:hypothetical protein
MAFFHQLTDEMVDDLATRREVDDLREALKKSKGGWKGEADHPLL